MILHHAYLLLATMALSFVVILFFGKRMRYKGAEVGIAAVGICLLLALASAGSWIARVNDAGHASTIEQPAATEHAAAAVAPGQEEPAGQEPASEPAAGGEEEHAV